MYVFLSVTAAFFLLVFIVPEKQMKLLCVCYIFAIAVIAYNSVPVDRIWIDLKSYLADIKIYRPMGIRDFWAQLSERPLPVLQVYLYLVSKLGRDGFLMGITITIVYSVNFYILFDAAKRYQIGHGAVRFAIIFLICTYPYYDAISWTKNPLAFALFALSLYGELIQGRSKVICWAGYLLALGLHTSITALIMLRVILLFWGRFSQLLWRVALIGFSAFIQPIMDFVMKLLPPSLYFQTVDTKVDAYFGAIEIKSFNRWGVCVSKYLVFIISYIQYYMTAKRGKQENGIPDEYLNYLLILLLFLGGTILRHDLFTRMTIFAGIVFQPVLLCTLQQCEKKQASSRYIKVQRKAWRGIVVCAVVVEAMMYLYFQYRGTLTLLEF